MVHQAKNINKLTSWEWYGLTAGHNIADGHAHQKQSPEYVRIISRLSTLFLAAEKGNQKLIQKAFEETFFTFAGQLSYKQLLPPLYQAACSLSIEVVANYLRLTNKSVALFHPTFDNLADILKRHKIPMVAIEEHDIFDSEHLKKITADALFLVCPNNPTGTEITREQFTNIVKYCKKYEKLLILDCSFRFYSSFTTWDQYEMLYKSGIDFIVLEDTGKTWPTLELKIGITVASKAVYPFLQDITNDFLLNVSPFVFILLTEYISVELKNPSYFGAKKIVQEHRKELKKIIDKTVLTIVNPTANLSVAWIKVPDTWKATEFCKWLHKHDIHVLPGGPFFWDNHNRGESYFRIALLRPKNEFLKAIRLLKQATLAYS